MTGGDHRHGGNLVATARRLGCRPDQLLDASASLVPFGPPASVRRRLGSVLGARAGCPSPLRDYPDRDYTGLRTTIAACHGLDPAAVLPGNGAAELFTWAARDAAAAGLSLLPTPGFADYRRALACWSGDWQPLPLPLGGEFPDTAAATTAGGVLWITNPHNPTGQLWSRAQLEPLLERFALVIVDEAFLPLVPGGEDQSLIPLLAGHPQLVVIRSLTKLFAIAGLRLGYALAAPERLSRWAAWRDPWPVNGLAAAVGEVVVVDRRWQKRVQRWVASEGPWFHRQLEGLPGLTPLPSAANFLLVRGEGSLVALRERLERHQRVLLRDCRSFEGLGEQWLRIGLQDRRGNQRILRALRTEAVR
ncbi:MULTISPECIES: histidinol-phosphate transaminase [unclassified Synechococcus]|uniref:pyridoxal phosphate-dependent aminotransferase n=1 Tax=unclassified Synechococcus TaxID=2626047 RepID=UPI0021A70EE3|nr:MULTISPECIES: aminotransferase class I/II-fold pyridoxal phosphate-dependent enzyme [unclassified Synechococcus]MCT0212680.1 aminotransferase class I/II-fold pyridoxal phosphate-dependent enzyme [Synechococcus sp. CS-1326]MCT0233688.1 aminotransferase class I/II-fold pyridoxal phosphate-dependent enzyme [Synechococcus sp. CS-1327]